MQFLLPRQFLRDLKKLEKHYPAVRRDIFDALKDFAPESAIGIGMGVYKVRIASRDQGKGKSGGFRSYLYLKKSRDILVPLCIYSKSERESISEAEMIMLLRNAQREFLEMMG